MSYIYVQTFYGASNGWRNVGGRRTAAKDAARFCALLGRIRNDRLNKVAEVPVTFVLGGVMLTVIQRKTPVLPGETAPPRPPAWPNKKSPVLPKF